MTTSVLKLDPNTQNVQKNAIYQDKTQYANFRGVQSQDGGDSVQSQDCGDSDQSQDSGECPVLGLW